MVPAAYYTTLHSCSSSDVPYSHLASDLKNNKLPAFSFVTPNLIDDMHNGTTADGNKWLSRNLPEQLLRLSKLGQAASSPTMTKAFNL